MRYSYFLTLNLSAYSEPTEISKIGLFAKIVNPFHATGLFRYPLKTSENLWFSDAFRGWGEGGEGGERDQWHKMC